MHKGKKSRIKKPAVTRAQKYFTALRAGGSRT